MKTLLISALSFVYLLCLSTPLLAIEVAGVEFPDHMTIGSSKLLLNGTGIRKATFLSIKVYAAGLYVEKKTSSRDEILNSSGPKKLVLVFIREVGKDKFANTWEESLQANNDDAVAQIPSLRSLLEGLKDVQVGERLALTVNGDEVSLQSSSGYSKQVSAPGFGKAILRIWLGPNPPDTGLQQGLLGG